MMIIDMAKKYDIPEELVQAIIKVESAGNFCAMRYEPQYKYLWDTRAKCAKRDPHVLPPVGLASSDATELIGQKTSWGPMQVMGAVAREYGFIGYFPELCGDLGVEYGCKHLARLRKRFFDPIDKWEPVISAYNAGLPMHNEAGFYGNQKYVDKVKEAMRG